MQLPVPADVIVIEEPPSDAAVADLLDEERALTARFTGKRLRDFATGRRCARAALAKLGAKPTPLLIGAGRQPSFPPGFVGSISHTEGTCAAAVAPASCYRSIGIDIEQARALTPAVASRIASEQELLALEPSDRLLMAMVLFSAKESFYKLQYPLTGEFVGFRDVRARLDGGDFELELVRGFGEFSRGDRFRGSWHRGQRHISTAIVLEAG